MKHTIRCFAVLSVFIFILAAPCAYAGKKSESRSGSKSPFDAPTISCGAGGSGGSVNVIVTAGPSGAPAGFSIHWVLRSELNACGWGGSDDGDDLKSDDDSSLESEGGSSAQFDNNSNHDDDDGDHDDGDDDDDDDGDDDDGGGVCLSHCEASFSGNAKGHYYALDPGESVTIPIGEPFHIAGASSPCDGVALKCGQAYAFRAFAHATSSRKRSAWSETTYCSTLACGGDGGGGDVTGCVQTESFWAITGPALGEQIWPVTGLTLGNVFYTDVQLELILNAPSLGTGLIELAQQLISAKLNVAAGAGGGNITAKIAAADALIGNLVVPPIGLGFVTDTQASTHIIELRNFNQGTAGPPPCE